MRVERIGRATLYLGRCEDVVPTLGRVDAVVSDPPYGQAYAHSGGGSSVSNVPTSKAFKRHTTPIVGDDVPFDPSLILDLAVPTILWGAHQFAHVLPKGSWLVWDKVPTGKSRSFGDGECAWIGNCRPQAVRILRDLWDGVCVADRADLAEGRVHPMQKPVFVMEWCLSFVPAARTILDPYMGSGGTGLACVKGGREFIGVEVCEQHFETALRRIEAAQKQHDLFTAPATLDAAYQRSMFDETPA